MTSAQDFLLPGGLTIQQAAAHIHLDVEDLAVLQHIYLDLVNHGIQSPHFIQALEYVLNFGGM